MQLYKPFLPFGPLTLKANKIKEFKEHPETLGEHLKKRRVELGLLQREVATELRISDASYFNWENDHRTPMIWFMPRLIEWLGYDPHPPPRNSLEWLVAVRRNLGLSRKRLAKILGADEMTVRQWEKRVGLPAHRAATIRQLYNLDRSQLPTADPAEIDVNDS